MRLATYKELKKYSFITRTEMKGATCYLYYEVKGQERFKSFPLRTSIPQLQKIMNEIQKEAGVNKYGKPKVGECFVI